MEYLFLRYEPYFNDLCFFCLALALVTKSRNDPNSKDNPKEATSGYVICVADHSSGYLIYAAEQEDTQNGCNMSLFADSTFTRDDKKC